MMTIYNSNMQNKIIIAYGINLVLAQDIHRKVEIQKLTRKSEKEKEREREREREREKEREREREREKTALRKRMKSRGNTAR